jgi:trimeric autotransporter adhesin
MRSLIRLFALVLIPLAALANTPGKHAVVLSWTASTTSGVTYNLYRGAAAGVCSGTPTPYVTGISGTTYTDTTNLVDGQTIYYNVSASKGGAESACDGELQVQIPVLPNAPSGLSGTAQ